MNQKKEEILKTIYDNNYCQMVFYVKKIVCSTSAAEDIVQDLFVKLLSKPTFNIITTSFIYVCLKNSALNYLSAKKNRSNIPELTIENHPADITSDINEIEERERILQLIIAELPPKCREVLIKTYYEKMKYAEVAKEMNLSFHTVKSHMNLAFTTIKRKLNNSSAIFTLFLLVNKIL